MEPSTKNEPRVSDYIRPLLARKWLILLAVVIATGAVYAWLSHKPNVYTAGTSVYVQDPGDPVTGVPSPVSTDRTVENEATLLDTRVAAARVKAQTGFPGTAEDLLQATTVSSKPGEDFVTISVNAASATMAADLANAFAGEFVTYLNDAQTARIAAAIGLTRRQLSQVPRGAAGGVQTATLLDQLNRLQLAEKVPLPEAKQVNPALPPAFPSSPKPLRDALFALALSFILAVAAAYGMERFDRRLKNPDEVDEAYQTPLLAVVPHSDEPSQTRAGLSVLASDFREPFRVLRTNIELVSLDTPARTIVVSSANPGEGKSTLVRNLALTFCEAGKRVAVVDLDLRHPSLETKFGSVPSGPGATDVLRGSISLKDAMLKVPVDVSLIDDVFVAGFGQKNHRGYASSRSNGANGSHGSNGSNGSNGADGSSHGWPTISLLRSGPCPANPPSVLASQRVADLLTEIRSQYDIVLIDTAPILAVTDTIPLLRCADAALLVGRIGLTTRDTARRLREFLTRVPDVVLLGVVANDLARLEASSYGYAYGYGPYSHHDADPGRSKLPVGSTGSQRG